MLVHLILDKKRICLVWPSGHKKTHTIRYWKMIGRHLVAKKDRPEVDRILALVSKPKK